MVTGVRRLPAAAAALALLAGGCGGADKRSNAPHVESGDVATSTTVRAAGSLSTNPAAAPRATPTTRRVGASGQTTRGGSNADANLTIRNAAHGVPGRFAGVVLAPGPATKIVLDVLVQSGVSADAATIGSIRQILAATSSKPVTVRGPAELASSGNVHSADDIRELSDGQGRPAQGDGTAVIHLLYLDGSFSDDGVLGATVRGDTVGVFPDSMDRATTPLVTRARIERAVITHEIGHVLGLVDIYLDEGRDDPAHPGHSTNPSSVMYWAVESDLVSQVLGGPPPVDFDGQDQADLRKIHNGAPPAH